MRRAVLCLALVALAGCASPPVEGPRSSTGSIVGDPGSPRNRARAHTDLAMLYYSGGNMNVALEEARIATAADPTYASAHGVLGLVYMELQENDLSRQSFERALSHAPEDPDINHNYGWFLCQIGRESESAPYFRRALSNPLYATPARSYAAAGTCALRTGRLAEADDHLQRALLADPNQPSALLQSAQLRYRQGRLDEARRLVARYVKVSETTPASLWLALRIERRLGARTAELSYANQLRRRFPGSREYQSLQRGEYE